MNKRASGILLHITSLPSPYGMGDLGRGAYKFADFLAETKQHYWQVLPLNLTNQACGNSPYSVVSTFAGNTGLISPEILIEDGFLSEKDLNQMPTFPQGRCDYESAISYKEKLFARAYKNFDLNKKSEPEYKDFCLKNSEWLNDFALFITLKGRFGGRAWSQWKEELKDRRKSALSAARKDNKDEIEKAKFLQYIFFKQWFSLKTYCNEKGIRIIGDLPIYVDYDSADVWTNTDIFKLDKDKNMTCFSGVPPDYFSETGQLWGNPVYRWDVLEKTGFQWWVRRMGHNLACFDVTRIDHFRGLVAYWEVPSGEKTAVNGQWVNVPVKEFFNTLLGHFANFSIIAEDLGLITQDVRDVMDHFKFPGMKVLIFAFGERNPMHPYLPHTYGRNWVVYTGTHDNDTVKGWFENKATPEEKNRIFRYVGRELKAEEISWEFVRLAMMSVADTAIFPLQDILGLDTYARMNTPATVIGNWQWRFLPEQLTPSVYERLSEITEIYGRDS
ncbi:MAG: 4-alpha-glucanotransferase [Omnitrophica bacterium RBG_13_46_9]|nr:MAG: 4-alpha-glucanotransferase [Omnitrophica bacterium RBG_13_46_9]